MSAHNAVVALTVYLGNEFVLCERSLYDRVLIMYTLYW